MIWLAGTVQSLKAEQVERVLLPAVSAGNGSFYIAGNFPPPAGRSIFLLQKKIKP
jgi:hypothetical protein